MNKRTVTLGGETITLEELPARQNAAWRQQLQASLAPFLALIEQAGAGAEIHTTEDLMRLVQQVLPSLLQAPDILFRLLVAYAPTLSDDLLDRAYDSEIIEAFTAVLGLAFPFGALVKLARSASGSPAQPSAMTFTNSPSPNGANPLPTPSTTLEK